MNSGSEANDLATLMARIYTKNAEIITLKNCYHGMTYQTMGLTSFSSYKYAVPQPAGIQNVKCVVYILNRTMLSKTKTIVGNASGRVPRYLGWCKMSR